MARGWVAWAVGTAELATGIPVLPVDCPPAILLTLNWKLGGPLPDPSLFPPKLSPEKGPATAVPVFGFTGGTAAIVETNGFETGVNGKLPLDRTLDCINGCRCCCC